MSSKSMVVELGQAIQWVLGHKNCNRLIKRPYSIQEGYYRIAAFDGLVSIRGLSFPFFLEQCVYCHS